MAQIEQSDGGKKKKGAQKKMHIHVDFTPMVDMNMLLITFFMLCTTMIKSQTLQITLPTNEKVDETEMNKAKESEGITMIVDVERVLRSTRSKQNSMNQLSTKESGNWTRKSEPLPTIRNFLHSRTQS